MIEKVRRALDLDAEMGHLCIEFTHCQRLVSTSSAIGEFDVRDRSKVAAHLARFVIREFNITPPRVPVDNTRCVV